MSTKQQPQQTAIPQRIIDQAMEDYDGTDWRSSLTADRNEATMRRILACFAASYYTEAQSILAELIILDDRRCLTMLPHPTADSRADNDDLCRLSASLERARKWLDGGP